MYDKILIATDGSDVAMTAANQGLAIAEMFDTTVHVLSVADVHEISRWETVQKHLRTERRRDVDAIASIAADRNLTVERVVRDGRPHHEILAYAEENDVDLLVLGTHGRTGICRWMLGSITTNVVRESPRPVLTVGETTKHVPRRFNEILVATDGRPGTAAAVDHAIALADAYGATVHALYVVDNTLSRLPAVLEEFERIGTKTTTNLKIRATECGVDVVRAVERGEPHRAIVGYAVDHAADLIVIGTEGRSGLDRLAFGSVAQRIVSTSPVPVLTVRAIEQDRS
ncbi:universal stress protein [Natronococcus wangiae]|uniref:universal stress protein n=1 Tax=Natronococcus wangiae TaxID=3068275 RepID=UPI00273FA26D|nr:universal stress protein [Natronococcus sp. AD5]